MQPKEKNVIVEKTYKFALEIIKLAEELENRRKFIIGNQVLKSGTAIGALVREAQNAESKPDFIHKFKIAAKEADETVYWLTLIQDSIKEVDTVKLLADCDEIIKIISKIIGSSKRSASL